MQANVKPGTRLVEMDQRDRMALRAAMSHVQYRLLTLTNAAGTQKKIETLAEIVARLAEIISRYDEQGSTHA